MFPLYNIVSDILYSFVVCVDFIGTHMASLVLFLKLGVTSPWFKVIWVSLEVKLVSSNPEENFLLNACVLLRSENIEATPDPLLSLALLRDEQRLSLGEFVDGSYHLSRTINIT